MAEPTSTSDWCQTLGITPPKLKAVAGHREANTFALLLVALLERNADGDASELTDARLSLDAVAAVVDELRLVLSGPLLRAPEQS